MIKIQVKGIDKLQKQLKKLEPKQAKKIARKAMRDAMKTDIKSPVKSGAPTETGGMKSSTVIKAVKRSRKSIGIYVGWGSGFFKNDKFYAAFTDLGTKYQQGHHTLERVVAAHGQKAVNDCVAELWRLLEESMRM